MSAPSCVRAGSQALTDYLAGDLTPDEEAAFEAHLFSCGACTRGLVELEPIAHGIAQSMRKAEVGGLVTDEVLNRLAREGVRVRTYALSPGDIVPCAVWEGDEMMAVRLRGDFAGLSTVTLIRRVSGEEVGRAEDLPVAAGRTEIIYATPAGIVRELPSVDIEFTVTRGDSGAEQTIGTYTLRHTALE